MTKDVLVVDSPDLAASLSKNFGTRACLNLREALAWLSTESGGVLIAKAEERIASQLLQAAVNRPMVSFIWLVESPAEIAATVASIPNIMLLPAEIGAAWLDPLLTKILRDQEQRRDTRELLEGTVSGTISTHFEVLSITDPYSASLGQRLRYAVDLFCKSAHLELTWELETAALLAEIGVLTIPARVVSKSQTGQELSAFEKDLISRIPERGADLLDQIPALHQVAKIVRYQGKNFDGTGFPTDSITADKIPLGARVLKVLIDLFKLKDNGKTQNDAIHEMKGSIRRYDPHLLEVARGCFDVNVPANVVGNTQRVTVRELRPGQLLVSNIVTDDGVLLIRDGQVVSARLLHKLRNFAFTSGIKEPIYVIDLLQSREMTTTFQDIAHSETAFLLKPKQR